MVSAPEAVVDLEAVETRARAVTEGFFRDVLKRVEAPADLRAKLLTRMAADLDDWTTEPRIPLFVTSLESYVLLLDHGGEEEPGHVVAEMLGALKASVADVPDLVAAVRRRDEHIARLLGTTVEKRFLTETYLGGQRRRLVDTLVSSALRSGPSDVLRIYRWICGEIDAIESDEIVAAAVRLGATIHDGRWAWWAKDALPLR